MVYKLRTCFFISIVLLQMIPPAFSGELPESVEKLVLSIPSLESSKNILSSIKANWVNYSAVTLESPLRYVSSVSEDLQNPIPQADDSSAISATNIKNALIYEKESGFQSEVSFTNTFSKYSNLKTQGIAETIDRADETHAVAIKLSYKTDYFSKNPVVLQRELDRYSAAKSVIFEVNRYQSHELDIVQSVLSAYRDQCKILRFSEIRRDIEDVLNVADVQLRSKIINRIDYFNILNLASSNDRRIFDLVSAVDSSVLRLKKLGFELLPNPTNNDCLSETFRKFLVKGDKKSSASDSVKFKFEVIDSNIDLKLAKISESLEKSKDSLSLSPFISGNYSKSPMSEPEDRGTVSIGAELSWLIPSNESKSRIRSAVRKKMLTESQNIQLLKSSKIEIADLFNQVVKLERTLPIYERGYENAREATEIISVQRKAGLADTRNYVDASNSEIEAYGALVEIYSAILLKYYQIANFEVNLEKILKIADTGSDSEVKKFIGQISM